MIGFQCFCLLVTLFVLYSYIALGISARAHRLLPLFLGLVAIYNFCQIVQCLTGESEILERLKDVMLLQVLYVVLHYVIDFCHIRLPKALDIFLSVVVMARNFIVFIPLEESEWYHSRLLNFAFFYMLIILAIGTYAFTRQTLTKREHRVANMMYVAFLMPAIALQLRNLTFIKGDVILPASLIFTCGIFYYLMKTDQLTDATSFLQGNLYDTSEMAMVLFDPELYFLAANNAARALFPEDIPKKPKKQGTHAYREQIKRLLQRTGQTIEIEQDGKYYQCHIEAVKQRGKCRGYALSIMDISRQKQELRQMEQLKKMAETQTELKGKFLASVSHDLRSPLHAIMGLSDGLIVKKELSAKTRASLMQIKGSSRVLLEQVNDILEYSKLEAGKVELAHQPYSLERVLKEVSQMCIVNLREKPVDFQVNFSESYPEELIGDELRVREIFQNILSNAVKHTQRGLISCDICCKKIDGKKILLKCEITDTGTGMSEEQLKQIFKEYESFSENQKGIGLGLPIVRQLTERMDGSVWAKSDGKSGSTFFVTFYQELGEGGWNMAQLFTKEMLLTSATGVLRPILPSYVYPEARVLLADDLQINRQLFKDLVLPWKPQIDTVESGEEVLKAVKEKEYHLIFIDQMMPGMTGTETAAALKAAGNQTPLVMLTADLSDQTREESQRAGFVAFLGKPISLNELKQVLEQYLPQSCRRLAEDALSTNSQEQQVYRRLLESARRELSEQVEKLPQYAGENLELFRTKVHGIKGFSRQISRVALAKTAEVMEMAAKTENRKFIETWLPDFIVEIRETIEEITLELSLLPAEKKEMQAVVEENAKAALLRQLKEGFENYDLGQTERCLAALEELSSGVLSEKEQELLKKAKEALEELDYELGSSLF